MILFWSARSKTKVRDDSCFSQSPYRCLIHDATDTLYTQITSMFINSGLDFIGIKFGAISLGIAINVIDLIDHN